ncbi:unnamed protein product [Bathycoccus prasinos]
MGFKGGGFRREGISFYTNLECATDILVSNGADKNNIHALTVAEEIKRVLVQGGVLILDLRVVDGVTQGLRELQRNGFSCEIFRHRRRGKSVKCVFN